VIRLSICEMLAGFCKVLIKLSILSTSPFAKDHREDTAHVLRVLDELQCFLACTVQTHYENVFVAYITDSCFNIM
jgi:hypothetical protein